LATVGGDAEAAEEHFESALALESRFGAPALVARTQLWYARMLLARDRPRALRLLEVCRATAADMGMARVAEDASALMP
jgi:hypothetical protein